MQMVRLYLKYVVFFTVLLSACVPPAIQRLEKIERLLNNLEKEIKLTKTAPELADLHIYINSYGSEVQKIYGLDYNEPNPYQKTSELLSSTAKALEEIISNVSSLEVKEADSQFKEEFTSVVKEISEFVNILRDRDMSIAKGETNYSDAEVAMTKADESLKKGDKEKAEKYLIEGKEYFTSGNSEFVRANALTRKLMQNKDSVIQIHSKISETIREKFGIELPEMSSFKFISKDQKRLERTTQSLPKD